MKAFLLAAIAFYQRWVSPCLGDCCRFEPSCSRYAAVCVRHHGALRGSWLACLRLLRCNPFFAGGIDSPPLPQGVEDPAVEPDWTRIARLNGTRAPRRQPEPASPPNGAFE